MCDECEYPGQLAQQEPDEYQELPVAPVGSLPAIGELEWFQYA